MMREATEDVLARRYYVNAAWRNVQNGPRTASGYKCQLCTRDRLPVCDAVESWGDLVEDEKRDRCGHPDVTDETADAVQLGGGPI